MSANRHKPHVVVLPEDDANRQVALGFRLELEPDRLRQIDIRPVAGGWMHVVDTFKVQYARLMQTSIPHRYVILLLDFDNAEQRSTLIAQQIPDDLRDRVFVLGVRSEPEDLKRGRPGSYEDIGRALARECRDGSRVLWSHDLLKHNTAEIDRMNPFIHSILF